MSESPDTIHGRMKEGAHLAGYGLTRAMDNLKWLLEGSRYEELSAGYGNVNDFLRDTEKAFRLLKIDPQERKQIATLVKALQPEASQRAIADMVGVDKATIGADLGTVERDRRGEISPLDTVKEPDIGEISPPQPWTADDSFDPSKSAPKQPFASADVEFYTPPKYIEAARAVLHNIDLDPASSAEANKVVGADLYYTKEDDGLSQTWVGQVYMNPPYGKLGVEFVNKLLSEYTVGNVEAAIILLNTHALTAQWFVPLWSHVLCIVSGRIKFYTEGGEAAGSGPIGSVFVYLGYNEDIFTEAFSSFGPIVRRIA